MTQSPIEPRHKHKAVEASYLKDETLVDFFAQTLANLEAAQDETTKAVTQLFVAKKALAEIDRIAVENDWPNLSYAADIREVAAIAAPYRASDPVAEELVAKFRALPLEGDAGCDKLTDAEWLKVAEAARAFIEGDR